MGIIWVHFYLVIISNVLVFFFLGSTFIKNYNSLTNLAEKMKEGWGQIEANLQRRYDALLTMSQVVQGYAGHEQAIDSFVAKAQSVIGSPDGVIGPVKKATDAEHLISGFMGQINNIETKFPKLTADAHFQELLKTIKETGNVITQKRESYNNMVHSYNAFFKKFPAKLYAVHLGFEEAQYFGFGENEQTELPELSFGHRAVLDGAVAGSPKFPSEQSCSILPEKQAIKSIGVSADQECENSPEHLKQHAGA